MLEGRNEIIKDAQLGLLNEYHHGQSNSAIVVHAKVRSLKYLARLQEMQIMNPHIGTHMANQMDQRHHAVRNVVTILV
jgi:hypothetical protein